MADGYSGKVSPLFYPSPAAHDLLV
jgi:hypothetical protein